MRLYHVPTNVFRWQSPLTEAIDTELVRLGSVELTPRIAWQHFDYLPDGEHFTWKSHLSFIAHLGKVLQQHFSGTEKVLLITDSTLEYHEFSEQIATRLREYVPGIEVDALCGSGFVALSEWNDHFRARLARRLGRRKRVRSPCTTVVVMGGWNDTPWSVDTVIHAVRGFVNLVNSSCPLR